MPRATFEPGQVFPADFSLAGSTSLGLSIVRTLVESELGGSLHVGPGPDGGTRVRVELQVVPVG